VSFGWGLAVFFFAILTSVCRRLVHLAESKHWGLSATTNSVVLPDAKPRALRQLFVVSSIGSRNVACAEGPNIRCFEHFLKLLDIVNGAFHVHVVPISDIGVAVVKQERLLARNSSLCDQINGKTSQPMTALVMLACHSRQTSLPVRIGSRHDRLQPLIVLR
jgi:hypothetical protein